MNLEIGSIIEGKITGITKFGAFVALPGGKSGMVHISEVANAYVSDIHEHLQDGQEVKVKVINITPEGKINLSIKKAVEQPARDSAPAPRAPRQPRNFTPREPQQPRETQPFNARSLQEEMDHRAADASFEDKLKQFMQDSDSKMSGSRFYEQPRKSRNRRK